MNTNDLLLVGYEGLTVILPFLITFVILNFIYRHNKIPQTKKKFLLLLVFVIYIFGAFYFTGIGTIFDIQRHGMQLKSGQINLVPFSREIDIVEYILNVFLFIPLGFLLPIIWPDTNKIKQVVLSGISFSLLIELSQLFTNRRTDIDDVIMNTIGTILGYLLLNLLIRIFKKTLPSGSHLKYEPAIYILSIFVGHFLMFNELGLAKILYGF
jgi:glycopeptide antibiotics resistance protein